MNERRKRLKEFGKIPSFAQQDHRNFLDRNGKPVWLQDLPRKERRKLQAESRKIAMQYNKILGRLFDSGVGYPVDQTMRTMAAEYTNRLASSGTQNFPVSFNYFEPFCEAKLIQRSVAPYMDVTPETNHLFNTSDFFDYLTSVDSDEFMLSSLLDLPEAQTYHFTTNGDIQEITFFDASAREYLLSGFSIVRRGTSIHWYLVAGELIDRDAWEAGFAETRVVDIENAPPHKRAFLSELIERNGPSLGGPVSLEGTETAKRTLIAGEIDAVCNRHLGKAIFVETEHSFGVFSDDPEVLEPLGSGRNQTEIFNTAMKRISEADTLWNIAEGLLQLPDYFGCRVTASKEIVRNSGRGAGLKGKGGRGVKARFEVVESVSLENTDQNPAIRRVKLPQYATETEGHWRRLKLGAKGRDKDGNPVVGKTWVKKFSPWRARERQENVVYVKDSLAVAKERVAEIYAMEENAQSQCDNKADRQGELYILRCALMKEEVYKVGWTSGTAESRAKQLSSATGVPLAFVVVESWCHDDPEGLETEVHALLSPYRLNNQREFFKLKYSDLRRIVTQTIERVGNPVS
ncbi:MAG: GIY-YIG nuclease family protein [Pseudoruegeria sp.]